MSTTLTAITLAKRSGFQVEAAAKWLNANTTKSTVTFATGATPGVIIATIDGLLATEKTLQGKSGERVALQSLRRALVNLAEGEAAEAEADEAPVALNMGTLQLVPMPNGGKAPAKAARKPRKAAEPTPEATPAKAAPKARKPRKAAPQAPAEPKAGRFSTADHDEHVCSTCGDTKEAKAFPARTREAGVITHRATQCRACRNEGRKASAAS